MDEKAGAEGIAWKEWSRKTFEQAGDLGRLVLLDLSADWCHWCHVMDRTTYSDPEVVDTVNREFVPVRVDIDARPDISERYNRGGFPTTAFLSDRGEPIWGATYIPPKDMKRIMAGILSAKASGEIAEALEKDRTVNHGRTGRTGSHGDLVDDGHTEMLFEDIFATYDVEHGGFGLYPKFPHPDVVDLLLLRYLRTGDDALAEAVRYTIRRMTDGLYDKEEGGVFRYSVTRDWGEPHYEKMLETNAGFLKNLTAAHKVFGSAEYERTAAGVGRFMLETLRDPVSGGFHGSQDADESYYRLPAELRDGGDRPMVVRGIYAGWNAEAVSALIEAGAAFRRREWLDAGFRGWDYSLSKLLNEDMGLTRHEEGTELYLFEDQVSFLESLLSVYSFTGDSKLLELGHELAAGIERHFSSTNGGYSDILRQADAVGDLGETRRSLVANARYARLLALLSAAEQDPELAWKARSIMRSFTRRDLEAHGLFAAEFLVTWHVLSEGARVVHIRPRGEGGALSNELWTTAKRVHNPAVLCAMGSEDLLGRAGAVICTSAECSDTASTSDELERMLRVSRAGGPRHAV